MLTPSKVISDQYGSHQVTTDAGKVLVGRAVEVGKELFVYTVESGARPIILKKDDVDEMVVSKVSQMPARTHERLERGRTQGLDCLPAVRR